MKCPAAVLLPLLLLQDGVQQRVDKLPEAWGTRFYGFVAGGRKIGWGAFSTRVADDLLEFEDAYVFVPQGPERRVKVVMRCTRDDRMTPRSISVDSSEVKYELAFKDGRASADLGGRRKDVEITPDTVTLHSVARLVSVLPREAGFERKLRYLNLETLEVSDTKLACAGEEIMPGSKLNLKAVHYRVANRHPIDLWLVDGLLAGIESPQVGGAVLYGSASEAKADYDPATLVCQANLQNLARMQHAAKKEGRFNPATGKKFWLSLADGMDERELAVFVCPSSGARPGQGVCTYRGPKSDVNSLGPEAVIGCDDPFNHADGIHVVTRSGNVRWVRKSSEEYKRLIEITLE